MHEVVSPSVLPCLGTLAYYLRRVATQFLMDAGMAGEAQGTQIVDVECQPLHLVFGSGSLNGDDVMYASGRCYNALLQTFLTQSVGASELGNAQLVPLAAVIDVLLVLGYIVAHPSPVSFLAHGSVSIVRSFIFWRMQSRMNLHFDMPNL